MSEVLTTKNVNFKTVTQHSGAYRYARIALDSGGNGNSITLDAVASLQAAFKLPTSVYNLSKSMISGTAILPAPAAKCTVAFTDVALPWVQSIQFGTMGGLNLVDLQNSHIYSKVARKIDTPYVDYETSDLLSGLTKADLTSANYVPQGYTALAGNSLGVTPGAPAIVAPSPNEPLYSRSSVAAAPMQIQHNVPLSVFTNTLFSMPQDMYFGSNNMYLRLNTAPSSKVGYVATAANNPIAGAAVLEAQPVISNIYLYLALEKDEMIIHSLMSKYASGQLRYIVPFTFSFRSSTVGAGDHTIQHNLTNQFGRIIKRLLYVALPASEVLNVAYDHSNYSGSKIQSYQSFLDSVPLQDAVLNCVQASNTAPGLVLDDWRENKMVCKGSVIQGPAAYQLNWFHCDSFSGKSEIPNVPDSQIYEGLDLTAAKQWSMQVKVPNATNLTHYVFATFARELEILPDADPNWVAVHV